MPALRILNTELQEKLDYLRTQLTKGSEAPSIGWEYAEYYLAEAGI